MEEQPERIFREVQKFSPWVNWLILIAMIFSAVIVVLALIAESSGRNPPDTYEFLSAIVFGIGVPAAIAVLFAFLKLETEVRRDGLYVRLFPLHFHFRKYAPHDITQAHARKYRPVWEYGGWGIRYSLTHGKAYNTRGNQGVQLLLRGGRKLLIGSQRPLELEKAIHSVKRQ